MKFRKKPVVIDAERFDGSEQSRARIFDWSGGQIDVSTNEQNQMTIATLEGDHKANLGDWIIRGVKGEYYPCKPDIFEATYDAVEDD